MEEQCCIYIDDSNLFIEGMKFLANKLSLEVTQDHRFRIEPESFVRALAGHRSVMKVTIYGSGTVNKASVWKVWRDSGVQTKVFQRCMKGQEKEVDSTLAADVVDKAACLRFRRRGLNLIPGSVTFIVVSGDRDYLQALKKVLKHGWKLEVVGWSSSMSMRVKEFVQMNEEKGASLIELETLARKASSMYFVEPRHSGYSKIPRSGFVFEYSSKQSEEYAKALSFHVVKLIKRPCQYLFTDKDSTIIKLVLMVRYNSQPLKQKHKWLLRNTFSHGCGLRISYKSTLALKEDEEDSETEQDERIEHYKDSEDEDEGDNIDEDEDNDDDDDDDSDDEDDGNDDNNNDNDDDEEQTEKERLEEEEAVKTDKRCVHKYRCSNGKRCPLYHTKSEKKHFSTNARHLGKLYKSQLCWSVKNPAGINGGLFKCPKRCPYAHSLKEARCYNCDPGGLLGEHWMDDCPKILYENCVL